MSGNTEGFNAVSGKKKNHYLAGWEVVLDGEEHFESFLETQSVDKRTAEKGRSYIQLIYGEDDLLADARLFIDGVQETSGHIFNNLKSSEAIGRLKYKELRVNKIFNFTEDPDGMHWMGGEGPVGFQFPENNCPGSFQYIGFINRNDPSFSWLPFSLNLVCPVYVDFFQLWLDYSDPAKPVVINSSEINSAGTAYEDLKKDSVVIFNQVMFRTEENSGYGYDFGFTGVPEWIQYPDIPRCPKINKTMRFVCQLVSDTGVGTRTTNVKPEKEWYRQYFEEMNFWGDGDLFVFFEPEAKIACYFIQHT